MSNKRGAYNKQVETPEDRQMKYITNLSKSVGEACDRWLAEKGLKGKSWKQQNKAHLSPPVKQKLTQKKNKKKNKKGLQ